MSAVLSRPPGLHPPSLVHLVPVGFDLCALAVAGLDAMMMLGHRRPPEVTAVRELLARHGCMDALRCPLPGIVEAIEAARDAWNASAPGGAVHPLFRFEWRGTAPLLPELLHTPAAWGCEGIRRAAWRLEYEAAGGQRVIPQRDHARDRLEELAGAAELARTLLCSEPDEWDDARELYRRRGAALDNLLRLMRAAGLMLASVSPA